MHGWRAALGVLLDVGPTASCLSPLLSRLGLAAGLGWRANEPWLQEVLVPKNLDWHKTGLYDSMSVSDWKAMGVKARSGKLFEDDTSASLLLQVGRNGPAFLAYPNFRVLLKIFQRSLNAL